MDGFLALYYRDQKEYAEAERLYQRAIVIYERRLGVDHPDTANSLDCLAALYQKQRNYAEAEALYWRALVIREKRLGIEHPDTVVGLLHQSRHFCIVLTTICLQGK